MVSRICAGHRDKARGMGDLVLPDWLAGAEFVLQMEAQASKCDHNEKYKLLGFVIPRILGLVGQAGGCSSNWKVEISESLRCRKWG